MALRSLRSAAVGKPNDVAEHQRIDRRIDRSRAAGRGVRCRAEIEPADRPAIARSRMMGRRGRKTLGLVGASTPAGQKRPSPVAAQIAVRAPLMLT